MMASPPTIRRNPPRSARPPPTPLPKPSLGLDGDRLKVFLRIRPLPDRGRFKSKAQATKPKQQCLVANGANSVALTVPHSKLADPKRARTELFDGFSAVFSPDSSQHDVFSQVMNPLVDEFLGGKSGLLLAMGPTGSGKTHTVFGSARNPGLLPLALRRIFSSTDDHPARSFCLSMFEILSEGKGERILDLLSDATDIVLQQSTIKGLKEVSIETSTDAESLVLSGMLKRTTAATNANSKSSRSQCIITIRAVRKINDVEIEKSLSDAVLTIADLAGAERERRTGNQGTRLLESNFINNTSMVFGLCLRALLEHQKNKKKPLEKHFKNSMLTRYLRDYLEGRKKMTLILNVKPGDDDYLDTSFLLRQASPYMKIKYTNLDDSSDLVSQKRSNVSLICQENKKKGKFHKTEVFAVAGKDDVAKDDGIKVSEKDEPQCKLLNSELRRVSRNEEIMTNFARALWTVLKQYKQKILESENAVESMRKLLICKDIEIVELEKKLKVLSCSCKKFPSVEDSVEQDDAVSSGQVAQSFISQSSQTDPGSSDSALNNHSLEEVSEETCHGPERSYDYSDKTGGSDVCDTSVVKLIDGEELSSRDCKLTVQVVDKELDRSESCSDGGGGVAHSPSGLDDPFDQSFAERRVLTYLQKERTNLSPEFIGANKKSPIEQSEEEREELHNITVEGIQHNVDIRGVKHHSTPSCSQGVNSEAPNVSSSQSSLQLQRMDALQQDPQDLDPQLERCNATVETTIVEYGCVQPSDLVDIHGGMSPHLSGKSSAKKAPIAPSKDCQAERPTDKTEDLSASKDCNRKNTRRRLRPVSTMMIKEFTVPDTFVDTKREERAKSSGAAIGRSDKLIRLLKAHPPRERV
ncbi:kinesin-like protein KIN-6 [Oryza brachyantha]|uniref:kinesin-like protein KIN-6 n=1 Tax=Oryza brachyantha TaxID=4533 RepID=UPI000776086D|nr:kinesin-like protein KIN-6 [Oryza brachyantha]